MAAYVTPLFVPQVQGEPSHLLYGDESGDVHVLTFANPCTHLFGMETRKSSGVTPWISYNVRVNVSALTHVNAHVSTTRM